MKVLTLEDLTKAAGGLGGHFGKAAAFHKAAAAHHEALHKHHSEMAAFSKGKHDAMDDGHEMKAYMGKAAEHHTAKAAHHLELHKLHKAHAEDNQTMADTYNADKVAGAQPPAATAPPAAAAGAAPPADAAPGNGVSKTIDTTINALIAKALESLDSDPKVAEKIQQIVLERVNQALGDKTIPSLVRGVLPDIPTGGSAALVPRPGQQIQTETVSPELASVFGE